jgi:hypothetical protein
MMSEKDTFVFYNLIDSSFWHIGNVMALDSNFLFHFCCLYATFADVHPCSLYCNSHPQVYKLCVYGNRIALPVNRQLVHMRIAS